MSHLHIPDGLLHSGWAAIWIAVALALVAASVFRLRTDDPRRYAPKIGVFTALLLLAMSLEWFGVYHLNLTTLAVLVLGPWAAVIAIFIANLAMAVVGHGGITVLGLNTVILCLESFVAWALFSFFSRFFRKPAQAAFTAALLALMVSFTFMVGTVSVSLVNPADAFHKHESGGFLSFGLRGDDHDQEHDDHGTGREVPASADQPGDGTVGDSPDGHGHEEDHQGGDDGDDQAGHEEHLPGDEPELSMASFFRLMIIPGLIGWPIEALIVASLVGFIGTVRPDLILGLRRK